MFPSCIPSALKSQAPIPPATASRLETREKSLALDYSAIKKAEKRGDVLPLPAPPLTGVAGAGGAGACLGLHISSEQFENPENKEKYNNTSFFNPAASARFAGSPAADDGDVYKIDFWRTSARVCRSVKTPRLRSTIDSRLQLDDDHLTRIVDFFHCKNIPEKNLVEIQEAYNGSTRGKIDSFSDKSRARLKFVAGNCFPLMISQFCLSYADSVVPGSGRIAKTHLDRFLVACRRKFPGMAYMWVLEFQTRKAAHFHVFFSFPPSKEKRKWLAEKWCKVVKVKGEDKVKMFNVHNNGKNFTHWNMRKGSYLTKYLSKSSQKEVPENFSDVGRFWGASRNLVPNPDSLMMDGDLPEYSCTDRLTGETWQGNTAKDLYRILRRHHEASLRIRKIKRKSRLRNLARSTTNLPSGGCVVRQYLAWIKREILSSPDFQLIPF